MIVTTMSALLIYLVLLVTVRKGLAELNMKSTDDLNLASLRTHLLQLENRMSVLESQSQTDAGLFTRLFSELAVLSTPSTAHNVDNSVTNVSKHILQLEQTVADLQSKSKTQEQKYAAVLSSVLSKLTTTTDDLTKVKSELKDTKDQNKILQNELENRLGLFSTSSPNAGHDVTGDKNDILRLEQALSDLQSKSQTQEQKYSAILSSVLSKLTQTSGDLTKVKSELEDTKDHNKTLQDELDKFKAQMVTTLNATVTPVQKKLESVGTQVKYVSGKQINLISEMKSAEMTIKMLNQSLSSVLPLTESLRRTQQLVAFQVENFRGLGYYKSGGVITPSSIKYNYGNGYSITKGLFTAPTNGVYLFWFSVDVSVSSTSEKVRIDITVRKSTKNTSIGSATERFFHTNTPTTLTAIAGTRFYKGESVELFIYSDHFTTALKVGMFSVFGGMRFSLD